MARNGLLPQLPPHDQSKFPESSWCWVDYGEAAEPWHERYVDAWLDQDESLAMVVTPDHDVFDEKLRCPPMRQVISHPSGQRRLPPIWVRSTGNQFIVFRVPICRLQ